MTTLEIVAVCVVGFWMLALTLCMVLLCAALTFNLLDAFRLWRQTK